MGWAHAGEIGVGQLACVGVLINAGGSPHLQLRLPRQHCVDLLHGEAFCFGAARGVCIEGGYSMAISVGSLFSLIIVLLVIGLLVWLAFYVLGALGPPEPVATIIRVIVVVIAVLVLIAVLLNLAGIGTGLRISQLPAWAVAYG
jgi:hypothetical protein